MVFVPDEIRNGETGECFLNRHFGLYVTEVVGLEQRPLIRHVRGTIARAATVRFCRGAGLAEILDEVFAGFELLFFQPQHRAHTRQRKRQAQIS